MAPEASADPESLTEEPRTVLVVTPHPDDAEGGAGGTIARWANDGHTVVLVVCTNGDKGTSDRTVDPEDLARIREREQLEAAKELGISHVEFLRLPDQGLEDTAQFREKLVRQIRVHRPHTVVTVDPNRPYIRHRDHYMTGRVTLDAVFPYARDHLGFPEHLQEGLEPHKVREVYLWGSPEPDSFVDTTDTFETRMRALHRHVSQVGEPTKERRERAERRCHEAGKVIGVRFAERFKRVELPG